MTAASTATERQIDDQFQPENKVTGVGPVFERCTDLSQASLAVKEAMAPFRGRHDLYEAQNRFSDALTKVLSNKKIFEYLVKGVVTRTHFVLSNMTSS